LKFRSDLPQTVTYGGSVENVSLEWVFATPGEPGKTFVRRIYFDGLLVTMRSSGRR